MTRAFKHVSPNKLENNFFQWKVQTLFKIFAFQCCVKSLTIILSKNPLVLSFAFMSVRTPEHFIKLSPTVFEKMLLVS